MTANSLPDDDSIRGEFPMADGLLDYFPNALAEIARHSKLAGDKHHPGEQLHWERGKSTDHRNKIMRHLVDTGGTDNQGNRHSTGLAWRALALLQEELEREMDFPAPRNAVDPAPESPSNRMNEVADDQYVIQGLTGRMGKFIPAKNDR